MGPACFAGHPVVGLTTPAGETDTEADATLFAGLASALGAPPGMADSPVSPGPSGPPEILLQIAGGGDLISGSTCDFRGGGNCFPSPVTLRIQNSGTGPLTLTSVTIDNMADFILTPPASSTVPAQSTLDFQLANPNSGCCITGILTIVSDDADEGTYTVNLQGDNS